MCGIVGIWRHDRAPVDANLLAPMLAAIVHRGPDDSGVWHDGGVALGHQRLTILDTSAQARQPMVAGDGGGVLVYNGEVYNYVELRRALEREGAVFRGRGDSEVVLEALNRWGPERSLEKFDGMFAFAYFDRNERALWLARDRLGIKPLMVADTGAELLFASEVKALLAHPRLRARVNVAAMAASVIERPAAHLTLFDGIGGLEAGTWWKVTGAGTAKRRYYDVMARVDVDRLARAGDRDPSSFVGAFRDTLQASVKQHLVSDVPLASMCSGGVDSSLILACAKDHVPDITGYVADVQWPGGEAAQAERVGRHLGVAIRRVRIDRERLLRLWPLSVWHSDGPPFYTSDAAMLAVAQACRADGIKVLLTGEGSDELFGGYGWYGSTYWRWRRLDWPWRLLLGRRSLEERRERLALAPFATMNAGKEPRLRGRLTAALDGDRKFLPQQWLERLAPIEPAADRALLAHCFYDLQDLLSRLLQRHDRMGMAGSIEMRVPFLHNAMFDLAFHLPRRAKLHGRVGKWVVKTVAAERLPREVVYAPKKGFPMPHSFTGGSQRLLLGGRLAQQLGWSAATTAGIVAMLDGQESLRCYLVALEMWLRLFFDGESVEALGERLVGLAADRR